MIRKRMSSFLLMGLLGATSALGSQGLTAAQILDAVDRNLSSDNQVITSRMVVHGRRASRTIVSKSWVVGTEKAFTEYLSPPREAGTKMLKVGNQLRIYSPQTDRVLQISGHMLRQSVMGSDFSYQDMMEDQSLQEAYHAELEGSELLDGRDSWVILLTAKKLGLAYPTRRAWVDKEWMLPMKEEMYAKGGKLLKSAVVKEVMNVQGRTYPKVWLFKDELKRNSRGTEWIIDEIAFNVTIPEAMFSKAALRR